MIVLQNNLRSSIFDPAIIKCNAGTILEIRQRERAANPSCKVLVLPNSNSNAIKNLARERNVILFRKEAVLKWGGLRKF
jgi:hypothetical protein